MSSRPSCSHGLSAAATPMWAAPLLTALMLPAVLKAAELAGSPSLLHRADDPSLLWGPCPDFLPEGCAIAVLHGDPAQANADVFFRVPGGAEIAAHWHHSAERMVLVAGELQVTYEGEPSRTMLPGSYAYGPAERVHEARCNSSEACVLFIAFEQPVDAIAVPAKD